MHRMAKRRDNCRQELKNIAIIKLYHSKYSVILKHIAETNDFDWEKAILDFEKNYRKKYF